MKFDPELEVDIPLIANGILNQITSTADKNALALGMLPASLMDRLKKRLEERYAALIKEKFALLYGGYPEGPVHVPEKQAEFVSKVLHEVSQEALRVATIEGNVIV
jgi:hypothetical protein